MNICILSNFTKSYFYHEFLKELPDEIQVYWIAVNRKIYKFLKAEYTPERVLMINRDHFQKTNAPIDDFKLNELIYGDRVLRYEPQNGLQFLQNIQAPIYDFFKKNEIKFVFGEVTWAHEVLVHRMCAKRQELNCTFLNPHVIRIPNNRFAFFTDERQSEFFRKQKAKDWNGKVLEVKKPSYLKLNDKILKKNNSIKGRLNRVKRFLTNENIDKKDPTLLANGKWRFQSRTMEEVNKEVYKTVKRVDFQEVKNIPYVFIGLHKQPEASVDVLGRYYEDQFQNIQNLWRALPQGWNLLVKEHTNAIGDRDLKFYKALQSLPNLYLIDEKANSWEIIRNAQLTATISGTIALEAALMQQPAVTFAPTFFNRLNYCRQISLEDLQYCTNLQEIAEDLKNVEDNRLEYAAHVIRNSFEGNFIDPIADQTAMDEENLKLIARAIQEVVLASQKEISSTVQLLATN